MADRAGAPKIDDRVVDQNGLQTDITLRFFENLDRLLNGVIPFDFPVYADLTTLTNKIRNPDAGMCVFVKSQGLAVYDGVSWVKSSDGVTLIT